MRQHLDAAVLVDTDVNIMALGERAAAWPGIEHLMFVKIATGFRACTRPPQRTRVRGASMLAIEHALSPAALAPLVEA